jgi:hypothetical protein
LSFLILSSRNLHHSSFFPSPPTLILSPPFFSPGRQLAEGSLQVVSPATAHQRASAAAARSLPSFAKVQVTLTRDIQAYTVAVVLGAGPYPHLAPVDSATATSTDVMIIFAATTTTTVITLRHLNMQLCRNVRICYWSSVCCRQRSGVGRRWLRQLQAKRSNRFF